MNVSYLYHLPRNIVTKGRERGATGKHARTGRLSLFFATSVLLPSLALLLVLQPRLAEAASSTANLTANMTVTASCTINTATLTFPSTPGTTLLTSAVDASTTVSVTCTNGSPYSIGMDSGQN